jgi:hypothetical protein
MIIYLTTFGGFSFGWIQDMWRLPSYCEQHTDGTPTNPGVAELEFHKINMKTNPNGPSKWQFGRFMGSLVVSIFYGYVTSSMFDLSFLNDCTYVWCDAAVGYDLCSILGIAIGVYTVGNLGLHQGTFRSAVIGALVGFGGYFVFLESGSYFYIFFFSFIFFSRERKWKTIETHLNRPGNGNSYDHAIKSKTSTCRRLCRVLGYLFVFSTVCTSGLYFHAKTTGKYFKRRRGTRMEHCSYRHSDFL